MTALNVGVSCSYCVILLPVALQHDSLVPHLYPEKPPETRCTCCMTTVTQCHRHTPNLPQSIHALTCVPAVKHGVGFALGAATIPILLITTSGADPGKEMEELAENTVGRGRYGENFRTKNTSKYRRVCSHERACISFKEKRVDLHDTTG